jgi:acyl-coenzyme A thioesterase PaaI-like protein
MIKRIIIKTIRIPNRWLFSGGVPVPRVTSSLTIDYADSAKLGDWIEIETDVQKVGNKMAFGNCYFIVFTFLIKKRIHVHKLTFHELAPQHPFSD